MAMVHTCVDVHGTDAVVLQTRYRQPSKMNRSRPHNGRNTYEAKDLFEWRSTESIVSQDSREIIFGM